MFLYKNIFKICMKNKFCSKESLRNESDVEQFFIIKLLEDLDYNSDYIRTKNNIPELKIKKGKKQESYSPDYILYKDKKQEKPIILIDAKHPNEDPEKGVIDAQLYTSVLRRKIKSPKPEQYCIGTNGIKFIIKHYESDDTLLELDFEDFKDNNPKYNQLKSLINFNNITKKDKQIELTFRFYKPSTDFIRDTFVKCHNLIWKRDKKKPTKAFYEFSKLIFVKLKKDRELKEIERKKGYIEAKDAVFSVYWLEEREKEKIYDPINNNLFSALRDELEDEIVKHKKKRIFEKDEKIVIKPTTIKEVVRLLEHLDLSSVDDDLNGRMFETFLRATVRGRELGQYFTPRPVVEFMTNLADLKIDEKKHDTVMDACCGSGGFLIEVMAILSKKIKDNDKLTNLEKKNLIENVVHKKCLLGIDADPDIARIGRMNMYLHGDGGSHIYCTDALDKNLRYEKGLDKELIRDLRELRKIIIKKQKLFDVVLTNPPFSMRYEKKKKDEKVILKQYVLGKDKKTGDVVTSEKSNVLFMERYYDFLKKGRGKLITIMDDTVLNGVSGKKHREFIKNSFIIKAVISLPFNTFKKAETSTKTSILYLRKKEKENEEQPAIFMAICNNIGHDDFGRETKERNNLKLVLEEYQKFENNEKINNQIIQNQKPHEVLTCPLQIFIVKPEEIDWERLDSFYYSPELKKLHNHLKILEKEKKSDILDMNNLDIVKNMKKEEFNQNVNKIYKYIEVGDVTKKGDLISHQQDILERLPKRARKYIKENDVIIAKNISSLGNVMIVPKFFDGQIASTGFIVLRPKDKKERNLLWAVARSEFLKKQMYYLSATAVQPEVSETIFKERVLISLPIDNDIVNEIEKNVDNIQTSLKGIYNETKKMDEELNTLFNL